MKKKIQKWFEIIAYMAASFVVISAMGQGVLAVKPQFRFIYSLVIILGWMAFLKLSKKVL